MKVLKISVVYKTQIWQDHQSVYRNTNEIISGTIGIHSTFTNYSVKGDIFSLLCLYLITEPQVFLFFFKVLTYSKVQPSTNYKQCHSQVFKKGYNIKIGDRKDAKISST